MKIRNGFVSNSSSSSFVLTTTEKITKDNIEEFFNIDQAMCYIADECKIVGDKYQGMSFEEKKEEVKDLLCKLVKLSDDGYLKYGLSRLKITTPFDLHAVRIDNMLKQMKSLKSLYRQFDEESPQYLKDINPRGYDESCRQQLKLISVYNRLLQENIDVYLSETKYVDLMLDPADYKYFFTLDTGSIDPRWDKFLKSLTEFQESILWILYEDYMRNILEASCNIDYAFCRYI